jgi:acetyl esterase/lipase
MEYLLQSEKISPSAITLIGDSAGAHLALGLLLHLTHPNPKVSTLEMEGRLSGAALISPWVMNATSVHESMTANKDKDLLSAEALDYWTKNFMGDAAPDYWNSLLTVPGKWWTEMPVEDILATYGDDELLRDAASELCNAIQKGHAKAITRRFSTELHAHMLMNRFLHINKPCESEQVFRDWLDGRLKAE